MKENELLLYSMSPTADISVLFDVNLEIKLRHLLMTLSSVPDIEVVCTDSSGFFDDFIIYLKERLQNEDDPEVKKQIKSDISYLDSIRLEMSTDRQYLLRIITKGLEEKQIVGTVKRVEKIFSEQNFDM
ncbi:MAG: hypothetical protein IJ639_10815, partial [Ruminococcus sp.]|nr:hypothetical protein [Ruminococcus sp.]